MLLKIISSKPQYIFLILLSSEIIKTPIIPVSLSSLLFNVAIIISLFYYKYDFRNDYRKKTLSFLFYNFFPILCVGFFLLFHHAEYSVRDYLRWSSLFLIFSLLILYRNLLSLYIKNNIKSLLCAWVIVMLFINCVGIYGIKNDSFMGSNFLQNTYLQGSARIALIMGTLLLLFSINLVKNNITLICITIYIYSIFCSIFESRLGILYTILAGVIFITQMHQKNLVNKVTKIIYMVLIVFSFFAASIDFYKNTLDLRVVDAVHGAIDFGVGLYKIEEEEKIETFENVSNEEHHYSNISRIAHLKSYYDYFTSQKLDIETYFGRGWSKNKEGMTDYWKNQVDKYKFDYQKNSDFKPNVELYRGPGIVSILYDIGIINLVILVYCFYMLSAKNFSFKTINLSYLFINILNISMIFIIWPFDSVIYLASILNYFSNNSNE